MKKTILLLLVINNVIAMEQPPRLPQRGQKRPAAAETPAPAAKEPAIESKAAFDKLPNDIKRTIISFLTTEKDENPDLSLKKAAKNIRSLLQTNRAFRSLADDKLIDYLIVSLANNYAAGDKFRAALDLGIPEAFKWLKNFFTTHDIQNAGEITSAYNALGKGLLVAIELKRLDMFNLLLDVFMPFIQKTDIRFDYRFSEYEWLLLFSYAMGRRELQFIVPLLNNARIREVLQYSFDHGNSEDIKNWYGDLVLGIISRGEEIYFYRLLQAGLKIDEIDDYPMPLFINAAIESKNLSILQKLINRDRSAVNEMLIHPERTPLMRAVAIGDLKMVELLLQAGADVNVRNNHDESAFYLAKLGNRQDILKLLKDHGAE